MFTGFANGELFAINAPLLVFYPDHFTNFKASLKISR